MLVIIFIDLTLIFSFGHLATCSVCVIPSATIVTFVRLNTAMEYTVQLLAKVSLHHILLLS